LDLRVNICGRGLGTRVKERTGGAMSRLIFRTVFRVAPALTLLGLLALGSVSGGFGPYSQISFNVFAPHGMGTQLLDLTLGISYSF